MDTYVCVEEKCHPPVINGIERPIITLWGQKAGDR